MADIIPAGERGTFTIRDRDLVHFGPVTLEAFEVLLREEARRRDLNLSLWRNTGDYSTTVEWCPN